MKYKVEVIQRWYATRIVEIEAETEAEAEDKGAEIDWEPSIDDYQFEDQEAYIVEDIK